jgi:hypothetical protein
VKAIAEWNRICDSHRMKRLAMFALFPMVSGCVIGTVAKTAVDVATIPVKVASAGVDAVTTSQAEADQNRGREIRKEEQQRGRELRQMADRCQQGRPLKTDNCAAVQPR